MRPAQQAENPRAGRTPARPGRLTVTLSANTANGAYWPAPLHAESVNASREVQDSPSRELSLARDRGLIWHKLQARHNMVSLSSALNSGFS